MTASPSDVKLFPSEEMRDQPTAKTVHSPGGKDPSTAKVTTSAGAKDASSATVTTSTDDKDASTAQATTFTDGKDASTATVTTSTWGKDASTEKATTSAAGKDASTTTTDISAASKDASTTKVASPPGRKDGCFVRSQRKYQSKASQCLEIGFGGYGKIVGKFPWFFIIGCLSINGLLGLGLLRMSSVNDVETVYVPENNQAAKDRTTVRNLFPDQSGSAFYSQHLANDGRYGDIIFRPKEISNVLTTLEEVANISQKIQNLSITDSVSGTQFHHSSLCARLYGNCVIDGDVFLSSSLRRDIIYGNVSFPMYNHPNYGNVDLSFYVGNVTEENGLLKGATFLKLRFYLRQDTDNHTRLSREWEREFLRQMPDILKYTVETEIAYSVSDSLNTELDENVGGDVLWFSLTFTLMITYASTVASWGGCVTNKGHLARAGVIAAGLSILSSLGFCSLIGVPFTNIIGVMPFLILGVGIDDTFILMTGWSENERHPRKSQNAGNLEGKLPEYSRIDDGNLSERLSNTLKTTGVSITFTSLTSVVAFLVGATSSFLSVRYFCIYAGVAVLFCYINQITFLAGCLVVDGKRVQQSRHCLTCRVTNPPPENPSPSTTNSDKNPSSDEGKTKQEQQNDPCPSTTNSDKNPAGDVGKTKQEQQNDPCPSTTNSDKNPSSDEGKTKREQQNQLTSEADDPMPKQDEALSAHMNSRLCQDKTNNPFERFPRWFFKEILLRKLFKGFIVVVSLAYLSSSIYGITSIQKGLVLKNLVSKSSYYHKYISWNDDYFETRFLIPFYFTEPISYSDNITITSVNSFLSNVMRDAAVSQSFTLSWMQMYTDSEFYNPSNESTFVGNLRDKFLPNVPVFSNDIIFNSDTSEILASRIYFQTINLKSTSDQGDLMLRMREIAASSDLSVICYTPPFIYFEQYVQILPSTLQTVGIAVAAMFVLSALFIPHPLFVIYITVAMLSILLGIFGFMYYWDLTLSSITMIHLIMSVGFSIDYCAHTCNAIMEQSKKVELPTDEIIVRKAMEVTGGPILNGAVSSFLGIIILVFTDSYVFQSFFKIMLLVISFGLIHSIFFLPTVFSFSLPLTCRQTNEERNVSKRRTSTVRPEIYDSVDPPHQKVHVV